MNQPQLAPPGAGLPFPENLIAPCLMKIRCLTGSSAAFTTHFIQERQTIHRLISSLDETTLSKPTLIQRPKGLEDSSRNWSILMTLDHLRIVHLAFIDVISKLSNEQIPQGKASTAAVKPDPNVTTAVIAEYEASCDALLKTIASIKNFKTKSRYPHPWFGPMDAHAWHALAASHMTIHRTQIQRILAG